MRPKIYLEQMLDMYGDALGLTGDHLHRLRMLADTYHGMKDSHLDGNLPPGAIHDTLITAGFLDHFLLGRAKVFRLAERFGAHLAKTALDVPCDLLDCRVGDHFLIELPFSYNSSDGTSQRAAIVSIGHWREGGKPMGMLREMTLPMGESVYWTADDQLLRGDDLRKNRTIAILAPDYEEGKATGKSTYFVAPLLDGKTIGDVLDLSATLFTGTRLDPKFIQLLTKTLLYINSGEPDLQDLKSVPCLTKKEKKIRQHWRDHCPFDIVDVGYGYHGKLFRVDETSVSGHFRWQPHGPDRSKVKLIWIDEHMRHYS